MAIRTARKPLQCGARTTNALKRGSNCAHSSNKTRPTKSKLCFLRRKAGLSGAGKEGSGASNYGVGAGKEGVGASSEGAPKESHITWLLSPRPCEGDGFKGV